jgi:hypothetical protein
MPDSADRRHRIQQAWDTAWECGEVDQLDKLLSPDHLRFGISITGTVGPDR